jgi:hypothetical protein
VISFDTKPSAQAPDIASVALAAANKINVAYSG